ncbi:MAG: alcohol dehydrogenase catalytic domain-containing protein [Propionicimonas sp.]|uniref:alcohol dehydrogenase catalytic domain-containing protein n=1 Tax=Propionicimonas sp. TaxID=1955623 RepID=UPI003D11D1BB
MKQAVLLQPNDLRVVERDVPALAEGEVLVKVTAALLCGTDLRIYTGRKTKNVTLPSVLGHETAGVVVDANGPLPDGVALGNQVCIYPLVPCGECVACRKGHPNICRNRVAFGYQLDGGLSQYVRVPANARQNIVPLPGVSAAEAALVEPLACALNGQNLAKVKGADAILVVGCGPLGLMHIRLAKAQGVPTVIAVDPNEARHEIARASGADLVLVPGDDTPAQVLAATDGGVDVVILAIGRVEALTPYLGILAPGARISAFAGFNSGDVLSIVANDIHYNEYEVVGASSCRLENFHAVADLVTAGKLHVADLVGTQLPLDRVHDALDLVASGKDLRVGVDPWL